MGRKRRKSSTRSDPLSNKLIHRPVAGIIGGTGFSDSLDAIYGHAREEFQIPTSYSSVAVSVYEISAGNEIVFVRRHGEGHSIPPHRIDHRANMSAMRQLGVDKVFSTAAVGSLRGELAPGDVLLLDDFIDFRGGEPTTFFDSVGDVSHTDFSEPFSDRLRNLLVDEAKALTQTWPSPPQLHDRGVYLCLSGPRYETPAEVRLFSRWGADVVGMTAAPEAILAREIKIDYACVAVVTNAATGLNESALSHEQVNDQMLQSRPFVMALITGALCRLVAQQPS